VTDNVISIEIKNVTGYVVISVVAKAPAVNQLPLALAADGTSYVGNNGEIGYCVKCRVNSSNSDYTTGDYASKGLCCTGSIPIHNNAVIRIRNITPEATVTNGIGYESLSFQKELGGTHFMRIEGTSTWPLADENGVITLNVADLRKAQNCTATLNYFRLCCGVISDDTIITVDEFE
jgi:hypothetical protein